MRQDRRRARAELPARPANPDGPSGPGARYAAIDMLRGLAIMLMFVYHFSFDLDHFGAVRLNFRDGWFWLAFRAIIVSLFLALVGTGLVLGDRREFVWRSYLKRLATLAACALLATLGSYWMFPRSFIFFGILHFILVASILGRAFVKLYWANLFIAVGLIAIGLSFSHALFDQRWLQWVGLMTRKPITEDYVPLLPWFGVVLMGMFFARAAAATRMLERVATFQPSTLAGRALAFGGRHSLAIYMLHQPIFIGALWVAFRLA